MTGQQTLYARGAVGLVAGAASLWLASSPRVRSLPQRQFDRMLSVSFAGSRLGLFALVFIVLRISPRGDVPAFYFDQAQKVLRHLLPYKDFESSYAPLHPYLDAVFISVWYTPLAIMLFSVLVELFLLPLWMRAGRGFLPEADLRLASLLYLASPISLQFVTIDGQDNVMIAVIAALAVVLILRSRPLAAGVSLGVSVATIKFLPLLYGPVFLAVVPKRWRLVLGAILICVFVYGAFAILHAPIVQPLALESEMHSAGGLPYVLETIFGVELPARLTDGCLLLVLAGIFTMVGRVAHREPIEARMRVLTFGMAAATLALLVMSKKSWPPYLMLALFPVCLLVRGTSASRFRNGLRIAGFALFSAIAVVEHSYWASMFAQFSSLEFHSQLHSSRPDIWTLLGVEILLVSGYLWLLVEALRRISVRNPHAPDFRENAVDSFPGTGYS